MDLSANIPSLLVVHTRGSASTVLLIIHYCQVQYSVLRSTLNFCVDLPRDMRVLPVSSSDAAYHLELAYDVFISINIQVGREVN